MKKNLHSGKLQIFRVSKQNKLILRKRKSSKNRQKNRKSSQDEFGEKISTFKEDMKKKMALWTKHRKFFYKEFYKERKYLDEKKTIKIEGELGLEEDVEGFIKKAEEFVHLESRHLHFDLSKCTRLWPSAVTLLCSYVEWCRSTMSKEPSNFRLTATPPSDGVVGNYLRFCGFYDYINYDYTAEETNDPPGIYSEEDIVKIEREMFKGNIEEKQDKIFKLVTEKSLFNADELEIFNDRILTEVLINVFEHGMYKKDYGWYNLTQYHPTTGIISVCVADNGMGIKNTLITGPQRVTILKKIPEEKDNAGDAIRKAFKKNVSGAINASTKKGRIIKRVERGAHRGNGLTRIQDNCKALGIPLTVLSQGGAFLIDEKGETLKPINRPKKIFAGTLYHMVISAKKKNGGKYDHTSG